MTNAENRSCADHALFTAERLLGTGHGWFLIGRGHQTYVTDRFVAVRANLVSEANQLPQLATPLSNAMTVPATVPPPSQARFRASVLERLSNEGITVHGDEADRVQHLYLHGEHIGWIAAAPDGRGPYMTITDRPEVEALHQAAGEVADRLGFLDVTNPEIDLEAWPDDEVGQLWDLAAYVLGEVRHAQQKIDLDHTTQETPMSEIRDNLSARVTIGRLSPGGAKMMDDEVVGEQRMRDMENQSAVTVLTGAVGSWESVMPEMVGTSDPTYDFAAVGREFAALGEAILQRHRPGWSIGGREMDVLYCDDAPALTEAECEQIQAEMDKIDLVAITARHQTA